MGIHGKQQDVIELYKLSKKSNKDMEDFNNIIIDLEMSDFEWSRLWDEVGPDIFKENYSCDIHIILTSKEIIVEKLGGV